MRIALLQIDANLAQPELNSKAIEAAYLEAIRLGADLAVAPELAVPGYLPGDRLFELSLRQSIESENRRLQAIAGPTPLVFGTCSPAESGKLWNELWWCQEGRVVTKIQKTVLHNFGFYDESRYFEPGLKSQKPVDYSGKRIGLAVGESIMSNFGDLVRNGATLVINADASTCGLGSYTPRGCRPTWAQPSKSAWRREQLFDLSKSFSIPIAYVNRVGADGSLLYDGESCLVLPDGTVQCAEVFEECVFMADTDKKGRSWLDASNDEGAWLNKALVAGIKSCLHKMRIESLVVGLSGGIDSSVVASLAAMAIGPDKIFGASLPTRFTSDESIRLARIQAKRLGIHHTQIDADASFAGAVASLRGVFPDRQFGLTDENLQSRCRGMLLMALTSEPATHKILGTESCAVLSTGNKSEAATGYFTLYGDGIGALCPIGDLLKARVYALAHELGDLVPEEIINRSPTAELRPNQTDESSLMPYRQLDPILGALLEANRPAESLHDDLSEVLDGQDLTEARRALPRVMKLIKNSEFKRRQLPHTLNVTQRWLWAGQKVAPGAFDY
ncbi:MAG: NAD(+) synthase [Holophagaceae bacterium]|nr:NAD(+) synthase [Holophagaceae bacterium]